MNERVYIFFGFDRQPNTVVVLNTVMNTPSIWKHCILSVIWEYILSTQLALRWAQNDDIMRINGRNRCAQCIQPMFNSVCLKNYSYFIFSINIVKNKSHARTQWTRSRSFTHFVYAKRKPKKYFEHFIISRRLLLALALQNIIM